MQDPDHDRDYGALAAAQRELGEAEAMARDALTARMFGVAREPDRIGRYRIVGVLGEGGMGVVFHAHDDELARPVALKVLRERSDAGEVAHARLLREAQAMAQLSHPNVVQVHDVGQHEGKVYIAMELIRGETLGDWVRGLGAPGERWRRWREIVAMFVQVGRGLAAAHAAGLVHRDFKPANALVGEDGRPRVLDFGLARAGSSRAAGGESQDASSPEFVDALDTRWEVRAPSTGSSSGPLTATMTATGAVMGTPAYISPEQLAGARAGPASDQFSYCVALHEALCGVRPFAASSLRGLGESMAAGVRAELPRGVELPRWLARVLDRGLERDPAARWPSMDALLDALLDDPAIRRRRWIFAGTLALLTGVVGLGSWAQEQRARAACEAAGEAVFEDWSPASQERLQTAFAATGLSYAQDSAERSVVGLERWAQSWAAARVQACEDGRAGDDEAALRATCLERQRWQLASTVALFAEADATTVEALVARAVPMIAALPRPAACAEPGALQAVAAAGEQAATGEFERARRELSLVAVDERAGRYEQALTRAEEARALADTLEDDALRAEVLAALGSVQLKRGDYHPAEATLRAGYFLASGIGHDPVAAQAGISLMSAVGYHGARPTEGFDWAEHVRAATRRMGEEHPGPRFFEVLGYVQTAAAEYGAAVASFERAVALRVELHGAEHPGLAEPLGDLGTVHQILGDLERAEEYNRRALEIRERALGPHHPDVGLTLRELGHVAQLRKDFAGAERLYRSALTVQEAALGPDHAEVALTLGALGVVLREQGSLDEALATHERALAVAQRSLGDHPEVARYHTNLGATLARLGRLEDALAQHRSGLELRERLLGPDHHALEESLNNLGMALERRGAYEEALAHYRRALVLEERALGPEHASVAFTLDNVGVALTALGRVEEALQVLRRALAIREAVLEAGHADFAASHDALGEALLVAGRVDEALAAHRAALAIREATRGPEHVLTAMTRRRLADALQERGDLDEALARYRQALTVQEADGGAPDELARVRIGLGRALLERGEREAAVAQLERARAAMVGSEFDPLLLAQASFALARALPSQGAGRGRARALARSSLEILESLGSRGDALRRALEEWSRRGDRGP